jgi:pimeloyl-ACP methyl ester carboxylesterase
MSESSKRGIRGWQIAALATAGAVGGLALANRIATMGVGEPESSLEGERGRYAWTLGDVFYTVKGSGAPLVLVHGIYAGASSYEYRKVFDLLARDFRVYALDLLGFGLSEKPPVTYTPMLYQELIEDFVRQVVGGMEQPVAVIASTLGAAYTIRAAADRPGLFSRLVLIEPTGFADLADGGETAARRFWRAVLRSPLIGEAIYNAIASRPSIRYFLEAQTYAKGYPVSDDIIDHYHTYAHQPGSRYAPASFISGTLNTSVASSYAVLTQPILLCWGKDARFTPLENARTFREANPRAELRVFDCGALPQEELPEEFTRDVTSWLRQTSPTGSQS